MGRDKSGIDISDNNFIMDKVTIDFNMLGSFMKNRILRNM